MTVQFDAIVIGTGQSGPALAQRLSDTGMKVAVVERKLFGGTCVNTGCIPTKTLVASAYAAHLARRAADYGVAITGVVNVDMRRVKQRKDEISGRSNHGVEKWMRGLANGTVYHGHAHSKARAQYASMARFWRLARSSSMSAGERWCRRCLDWIRCLTSPTPAL